MDFFFHIQNLLITLARNYPIFSNGCIWEVVQGSTTLVKATACYTRVDGVAGRVNVTAKTFRRIRRACNIRLTRIVGNKAVVLDELVCTSVIATVARTCCVTATVKNVLNGEIDIHTFSITGNLNTICKSTHCSEGPTAAAVCNEIYCSRE